MERRTSGRIAIDADIKCRIPATPQSAIIRDLSVTGCRIETVASIRGVGGTIVLDLTETVNVVGTIVWARGREAGIHFNEPLDLGRFVVLDWIEGIERGMVAKVAGLAQAA